MVANLVCTTDCSSAKSSVTTAPAAAATGLSAAAVMATVAADPPTLASRSTISVVVPDLDKTSTRSYRRPAGISEAANASVSPCPDASRSAA